MLAFYERGRTMLKVFERIVCEQDFFDSITVQLNKSDFVIFSYSSCQRIYSEYEHDGSIKSILAHVIIYRYVDFNRYSSFSSTNLTDYKLLFITMNFYINSFSHYEYIKSPYNIFYRFFMLFFVIFVFFYKRSKRQ